MPRLWEPKQILEGDLCINHLRRHRDHISRTAPGRICGVGVGPGHQEQPDGLDGRGRATRGGAVKGGGAVGAAAAVDVDGGEGEEGAVTRRLGLEPLGRPRGGRRRGGEEMESRPHLTLWWRGRGVIES